MATSGLHAQSVGLISVAPSGICPKTLSYERVFRGIFIGSSDPFHTPLLLLLAPCPFTSSFFISVKWLPLPWAFATNIRDTLPKYCVVAR
ncbi:hypothetical protein CKO_04144 [Citrobacter koseri ATCC BAA-895]|uniref:Uncharacterized protein n=1 Tax=Citrobacter koseri (strain ATCC BAA-895 / CDC 4225-83 / SGSC4696) TaxID=290338 RepID=A8ANZ7_CITK8|nr:hypothetical protein CKO_04144 [Citrobacter koseri ATCC BAA-895]